MSWWATIDDPRMAQSDPVSRGVVEAVDRVRRRIVESALLACMLAALVGGIVQLALGWRADGGLNWQSPDLLAACLTLAVGVLCWALLNATRAGRTRMAITGLIVVSFAFAATFPIVFRLGLHAHSLNVLLPMIVFAALTLGPTGARRVTLAGVALVIAVYVFEITGGVVHTGDTSGAIADSRLVAHIAFIGLCGWLSIRFAELFREALYKQLTVVAEQRRTVASLTATQETLQRSERFLRLAADAIPGTVAYWTRDMVCTFANRGYAHYLGLDPQQMVGRSIDEVLPPKYAQMAREAAGRSMAGEAVQYEITGITPEGKAWVGRMHYLVDADGADVRGCFVFGRDITDVRAAQKALEEANDALRERTRQAEAANEAKSRFLATMSHEVRTPLNGILGAAQLLRMPGIDDDERIQFAETILGSGRALQLLLNDVLDLAKIEAGKLDLAPTAFSPAQLLHDVTTLFSEPARAKSLSLTAQWHGAADALYVADMLRLRQMLDNLVSNAIKFTVTGSVVIDAALREVETGQPMIEFAVTDTGIGVSETDCERLFQPFSQIDEGHTRQRGGTGLGLAIVRHLAVKMDGEIGVDTAPGKGSRFWFRVPVRSADGTAGAVGTMAMASVSDGSAQVLTADGRVPQMLVVEDEPANRRVLVAMLMQAGCTTVDVADGVAALAALDGGARPDGIVLDMRMPRLDGCGLAREIRRRETDTGTRRVPIIAGTARAYAADREAALDAGVDEFLVKPIDYLKLLATLHRHVGGR